jgi:hypothetical protein
LDGSDFHWRERETCSETLDLLEIWVGAFRFRLIVEQLIFFLLLWQLGEMNMEKAKEKKEIEREHHRSYTKSSQNSKQNNNKTQISILCGHPGF